MPGEPEVLDVDTVTTAVIRGVVPMGELPAFFDRSFTRLGAVLQEQGVAPAGPAFALYHGLPSATADLEVGFPTATAVRPEGDVTTPGHGIWEVHLTEPTPDMDPADLRTELNWPLRS